MLGLPRLIGVVALSGWAIATQSLPTAAAAAAVAAPTASPSLPVGTALTSLVSEFEEWMSRHGRAYASLQETARRFEVYVQNAIYVHLHNVAKHLHHYELELNEFADLTLEEFRASHLSGLATATAAAAKSGAGHQGQPPPQAAEPPAHQLHTYDMDLLRMTSTNGTNDTLPVNVDWRDSGCVTSVKNQGRCGSCYSFSAVGAIESATCLKSPDKKLVDLSEEQVISCGFGHNNIGGCQGGLMTGVFEWVQEHGGLCTAKDFPYIGFMEFCHPCKKVAKLSGYKNVPKFSEQALQKAVATVGPISIAIEADQSAFQFYKKGIMTAACGDNLDHGVLLVGYGKDATTGLDYWLVKNSWGPKWGESGYIRLARKSSQLSGTCGILAMASYPIAA